MLFRLNIKKKNIFSIKFTRVFHNINKIDRLKAKERDKSIAIDVSFYLLF